MKKLKISKIKDFIFNNTRVKAELKRKINGRAYGQSDSERCSSPKKCSQETDKGKINGALVQSLKICQISNICILYTYTLALNLFSEFIRYRECTIKITIPDSGNPSSDHKSMYWFKKLSIRIQGNICIFCWGPDYKANILNNKVFDERFIHSFIWFLLYSIIWLYIR